MTFNVGDKVIDVTGRGEGTITEIIQGDIGDPIRTSFGNTYKLDGRYYVSDTLSSLKLVTNPAQYTKEEIPGLATIVTLADGTRIYHPDSGQPFILPTRTLL